MKRSKTKVPPVTSYSALAKALGQTLMEAPDREAILRHAGQFSWERTVERYMSVLEEACAARPVV